VGEEGEMKIGGQREMRTGYGRVNTEQDVDDFRDQAADYGGHLGMNQSMQVPGVGDQR
jgi:hypothetical protein